MDKNIRSTPDSIAERESLFPSLRQFVENDGYEVVMLSNGERSAVPMDRSIAVEDLAKAEHLAEAVKEFIATTSVFRQQKASRDAFEAMALALIATGAFGG